VCRNYALETLSLGGLYIAGGVAARNPELIQRTAFRKEFRSSDTLTHILEKIPVFLITDQNSGLWGAAQFGLQKLKER
jgi:glucokinase